MIKKLIYIYFKQFSFEFEGDMMVWYDRVNERGLWFGVLFLPFALPAALVVALFYLIIVIPARIAVDSINLINH